MSDPVLLEHINVLLQDTTFLKEWKKISDAIEIPVRDLVTMEARLNSGNATMYDVIKWMLETWRGRKGILATVTNFIAILEREQLQNAADLLKAFSNVAFTPPTQNATEGMQQRNLIGLERLDVGSFGEVFKVECIFDGRKYALKRISVGKFLQLTKTSNASDAFEYFRKLMREVLVMARLQHLENVVAYQEAWFEGQLRDTFTEWLRFLKSVPPPNWVINNAPHFFDLCQNTYMCIKMELLDINLAHWYYRNPDKFGNFEIIKVITKQIFAGLASIHENKIIHRDLKPTNILITIRGGMMTVKIGDFGLSREMAEVNTNLTNCVGGRTYSSPEMERGDTNYTLKTDIFSVGLIIVFMLYSFDTLKELEKKFDEVRRGDVGILDDIESTQGLQFSLLRAMLHRMPEERPTAEQALVSLNQQ